MIIVFGAITLNMVFDVDSLPGAGETAKGGRFTNYASGRGANQALAATRTGAKVALVGRVGDDGNGLRMVTGLRRDGVITSGVAHSPLPTGLHLSFTDGKGHSANINAPGANTDISGDQVPDEILTPTNMLLVQTETPPEQTWALLERAKNLGTTTILNLAPVVSIPQKVLNCIDYLIVNQMEARQIAEVLNIKVELSADRLAQALSQKGNLTCIVTVGIQGSVAATKDKKLIRVPALNKGEIVDHTGASDAYCGTLTGLLHAGTPLSEAMRLASVAGTLCCMKKGAHESYAYIGDIKESAKELGEAVVEAA